jgi:hypothetical protein
MRADRFANDGPKNIAETVGGTAPRGLYRFAVQNRKGKESEVLSEIRYRRMCIQTAQGKKKRSPEQIQGPMSKQAE